ncbi:hypothetical protein C2E23DRAFT_859602 [Lenzites betulinus]|nr:hypothetical protein C2E23DRAFT_859602 [Lenzites betulinus]
MSVTTTYRLHPVSALTRDPSPTSSSTTSDRTPPPFSHHHHHLHHHHSHRDSKFLPPAPPGFSPLPASAPRRPLSPSSLRDVDPPLDPARAFAARGKFPAPPTGHELMALFPPAPPPVRPGPTSGFFQREERKFFAQAGKEIVRVRLEIDTVPRLPLHPHPHPHPHQQHSPALPPLPAAPAPIPHTTSPRTHLPPPPASTPHAALQPPPPPVALGGPGYPPPPPPPRAGGGGGAGDAMVVEEDDEAWRLPTPHNARRRAGKHTRRVIVK